MKMSRRVFTQIAFIPAMFYSFSLLLSPLFARKPKRSMTRRQRSIVAS